MKERHGVVVVFYLDVVTGFKFQATDVPMVTDIALAAFSFGYLALIRIDGIKMWREGRTGDEHTRPIWYILPRSRGQIDLKKTRSSLMPVSLAVDQISSRTMINVPSAVLFGTANFAWPPMCSPHGVNCAHWD